MIRWRGVLRTLLFSDATVFVNNHTSSPQEMRDCPAALLVVASTSDPRPIAAFHELASASNLPRPFAVSSSKDPDILLQRVT